MTKKNKNELLKATTVLKHNMRILVCLNAVEAASVISFKSIDAIDSLANNNIDTALNDIYCSCCIVQKIIYQSLSQTFGSSDKFSNIDKLLTDAKSTEQYYAVYNELHNINHDLIKDSDLFVKTIYDTRKN